MSLFNGKPHPIGSPEWADMAERAEWSFMAQMLKQANEELLSRGFHLSGLTVAYNIAHARSLEGWRTFSSHSPRSETPGIDTKTSGTP